MPSRSGGQGKKSGEPRGKEIQENSNPHPKQLSLGTTPECHLRWTGGSGKTGHCKRASTSVRNKSHFPHSSVMKNLPAMQETLVLLLGQEDPLEKEMATHSSILAWRVPWTEEPGRLQFIGSHRVRHDWSDLAHTKASACHSRYAQETLLRVVMHLPMASSDHVFFLYFLNN